jgi:hypothetical protein
MRKIIFLCALFLLHYAAFTQPAATIDTVKRIAPDSASAAKKAMVPNAPADTAIHPQTAKSNADSLSLADSHDYQMKHPEILYVHAFKKFTPVFIICLVFFLIISYLLLSKTGLCRDLSYDPETNMLRELKLRPYSYSRLQLFWWTVIILICFTSFFFFTGWLVAFNSTIVLLLGGGLAVSIFGNVIDRAQIGQNSEGYVPVRHQDVQVTKGVLIDILSDDGGVSVHRFQAIVFNIIFGLGFIHSFYAFTVARIYPFIDFEQWQLTLLGISSAGYLGFKMNENAAETKAQREKEAVMKNNKGGANFKGASLLESVEKPAGQTNAFQQLKADVANR